MPLAPPEIAGLLNLRGRIVTAIDLRGRLGLPRPEDGKPPMAVGLELGGESYALVIDGVGEVLKLGERRPARPSRQSRSALARSRGGVHRLDGQLLVILDVDRVLELAPELMAA